MIFFTGGKTCVAPDYILCDKKIHDKLLSAILAEIDKQFGESGMGGYHGEAGFETFSHYRSIVDKKIWMDLPVRYQKYIEKKEKILRRFL